MKKAFSLLELVFVIVVIGILAAVIIPRINSDRLQEAAIQLASHIRYTQHLAMLDDKYDANNPVWFKQRWQLVFGKSTTSTDGKIAYTIFSDRGTASTANPTQGEMAIDPVDSQKYLSGGYSGSLDTTSPKANKKMNLGYSYGIVIVTLSGGCNGGCNEITGANCSGDLRIAFDHLGRPMKDSLYSYTSSYKSNYLIESQCNITLTSLSEGNVTIVIEPETGYTHIL
ncbi:type II secretion system GspH family protein [bacterium]|nr:type II secretion system GspH family protein [bacterium]MBU1990437.1 type II secretion system GspH family protein [bacterium]